MASQTFPPTELKLDKLRKSGIVPFSNDVTSFAVILGSGLGLLLAYSIYRQPLQEWIKTAWTLGPNESQAVLAAQAYVLLKLITGLAACFLFPVLTLVFVLGGLQTRFLFAPGLLGPDLGRFFRSPNALWQGSGGRFAQAFFSTVKVLCWLLVAALLFNYLWNEALAPSSSIAPNAASVQAGMPGSDTGHVLRELQVESKVRAASSALRPFWTTALILSFFIAVLSRYIAVLRFREAHRMSRAEYEEELRETEPSPEFKGLRRELFSAPAAPKGNVNAAAASGVKKPIDPQQTK